MKKISVFFYFAFEKDLIPSFIIFHYNKTEKALNFGYFTTL